MSAPKPLANPFGCHLLGRNAQIVDAQGRIAAVKKFTLHECQAALQVPGLQATVLLAIDRRLTQCAKATRKTR